MSLTMDDIEAIETIEPEELRDGARRLLADKVDRRAGWGHDSATDTGDLYGAMAELGWLALTAPTANGGLGQSFAALAPIYEEMGRALSPISIAPTMAAIDLLTVTGGNDVAALLARIVSGEARLILLSAEGSDHVVVETVPDAVSATTAILLPGNGFGDVRVVELDQPGVAIIPVQTWDRGRCYGDVHISAAHSVSLDISATDAARIAQAHCDLAMAWDCVGAARQALDEALAYMTTRQQFGRPIGSFQALKHRAADLKVGLDVATALTAHASTLYADRRGDWATRAGQARLLAADAFSAIAEESVQFHGGIGFTWEHDAHLFLKRALMNEMQGGSPEELRDRLAPSVLSHALARQ